MSADLAQIGLQTKLGLDVFKESGEFHIHVRAGHEHEAVLNKLILVCPAGLYSANPDGGVDIAVDGCLECGTCRLAVGVGALDWRYPLGGEGVQYRFG